MATKDLDWDGMDPSGPAPERSEERGHEGDTDEDEFDESEEMDDDEEESDDIADEGTGHRG